MRYKFRAWDKTVKRMVTPDSLYHNVNFGLQCNKVFDGISTYTCLPEELILMQFTGLYDKNGKEIYEGDIVTWFFVDEYVSYKVEFISGMFALHINGCNYPLEGYVEQDDFKRIGNIHENPELLEQK